MISDLLIYTQQCPQNWKWSVFIPIPRKANAKESSNYCTIALISHESKVMLKLGFNSTRTKNFQMYKLDLEKADKPEANKPNYQHHWNIEKARLEISIYFCFIDHTKAFDCVDHNKL